jgi:hypothetical protein
LERARERKRERKRYKDKEIELKTMTIKEDLELADDDKERLGLILRHFGCKNGSIYRMGDDGLLHLSAVSESWKSMTNETTSTETYQCFIKNNSYLSAGHHEIREGEEDEPYKKSSIESPIQNSMGQPIGVFCIEKEGHGVEYLSKEQLNELHELARHMEK